MNINRDYLIINNVKKSSITLDNDSMFFYITDKNTQNIFVNLVINISNNDLIQKYANIENAEDYTLTMNIVKPDNTFKVIEGKLHDKEKAIFEFNLKEDCVDKIGTYRCELLTKCNINGHEEITTSNSLTYTVNSSILNDLDEITEAPEYPAVIQLFDKLSDIEQYEEDRRANELARQLAEEQRQTRFNVLDADMTDRVTAMDDKMVDVENRVSTKEQAVDTLIVDTKADIDGYKVAKDQEIDDYKTAKDTEINNAITAQDSKIDTNIKAQNDKINSCNIELNKRVKGVKCYTNKFTEIEKGKVYNANGADYIIAGGDRAKCLVGDATKAKITGYGWDSNYGYWLYAFFDKSGNKISSVQNHKVGVAGLEIDIPKGTYELRVNGSDYHNANIELFIESDSFAKCYEVVQQGEKTVKLITLGDSITELGTGERGWIKYFLEKTNCTLISNVAVSGAVLHDKNDTPYDGNPVIGSNLNVLGNQVQKIINNNYDAPDIIIIAIGTNGGINITKDDIKNTYYDSSNNLIPLENVDRKTDAGAYRYALDKLHELYPNAIIFWSTPIIGFQTIRSAEKAMNYAESLKIATEFTGQALIDTIRCGINGVNEKANENGEYLIDGLHPNINGAKKIGYYIASKVKPFLNNVFTEG